MNTPLNHLQTESQISEATMMMDDPYAERAVLNNIEDAQQLIEDYLLFIYPTGGDPWYLDRALRRLQRAYQEAYYMQREEGTNSE